MNHPFFPANQRRRSLRRSSQLLPLEQRFMFDGAVADAAHAVQAHEVPPAPPAVTVRAAEPAKDGGKKEVAIIDTSLAGYKTLEAGVRAGVGIIEFDGSQDGLAQIAQWAATQSNYDAIHILSHGAQGVVDLGTMHLSESALSSAGTQQELAQLGKALTSDGDLLFYGCDVGAGAQGTALLAGLAHATGADVAASTDATGAAAKGGDWTLETHAGKIETRALGIGEYQDLLTLVTITNSDANYTSYFFTKSVNGVTFTFTGDPNYGIGMDSSISGPEGLFAFDTNTVNGVKLTITAQSGYMFDFSGLDVGTFSTNGITIQYTDAANQTGSLSQAVANGSWQTVSGLASTVKNVVSIVLTADDFTEFQYFNFTNITTIAPAATVNGASLSSDSGTSNSDFITNVASQTITGSLSSSLGTGEKVQVSYDNGSTWSDATSYTVGSSSWSTSTTLSGSNTFKARVTNSFASSTAYSHSYTLDTTAPGTTFSNVALSSDTGSSNTDFITSSASQTISATLSGALGVGDVLKGSLDGGSTWTDITAKVAGTTLTWNGATLGSGANTLMLKVTDAAGNDSSAYSRSYTLDTTAPATTISSVGFSSDSGSSSSDFITSVAAQTISGTLSANLQSGETVYVSMDNGSTWTAAAATVGMNTWSLSGVTLTGSNTMRIKVSDTAGNDGTVRVQAFTFDTTSPTTTFSGVAFSNDSGVVGDFITNTASQTISATLSGSLAAGDILYGSLDGGATWSDITSKVSGTSLSWTGVTLAASNTLQFKVVDAAGNQGAVHSQAYVLDASVPAAPSTPVLTSDSGISGSDLVTNDSTPTFTGSAESGSTVKIYDGATLLGSVTATGGVWSYTATTLADGSHNISATATDLAGNVSPASSAIAVTVDTTAPVVSSVSVPANATYYTGNALDFTVNFSEAVYVDSTGGTPRIALVIGSTTRYASYVSGSGTGALLFRYSIVNGDSDSNGITIGALSSNGGALSDLAGNLGVNTLNSVGSTAAVLVDGSQPGVTNISSTTADGAYRAGSTITITVDFSGTVNVDTTGGAPTMALNSGGTATYSGGSGTSTLTFSYTVGAGENSADLDYSSNSALSLNGATITGPGGSSQNASLTLATPGAAGSLGANKNIDIDTIAPAITGSTVSFSADTGSSATDLITSVASQNISGTLTGSLSAGDSVQVSLDNGNTWTAATAAGNSWSLATPVILTGSNTLQVRVVDSVGNIGSAASYAYALDTTGPATLFSNIALANDTGISNSDLITSVSAQTISATLSGAMASGDRLFGSLDNGATWTDITGKVSGTTLNWDGVALAGSNILQLQLVDAAGNYGAVTGKAYVLDTTAPNNTIASSSFSDDSGSSASDFITNVAAQTVSGTLSGNLAAGDTIYVSLDNGTSWHAATASVGQNSWSLGGQSLGGSNTLLVKVSDLAGNESAIYAQAYAYDTAAPVTPSADTLLSSALTPVLSGSATLAGGETLTVTVGGAQYTVSAVGGHWTLDLSSATPVSGSLALAVNGSYDIIATAIDVAGNISSGVGRLTIASPQQVTGFQLSADSGISNSDFITNIAAQTVSGTLSAPLANGQTVEISADGGATWISALASGTTWSANVTLSGSNTLMARVASVNGSSTPLQHAYLLDTTAPTTIPTLISVSTNGDIDGTLSAPLNAGEAVLASLDGGTTWSAVSAIDRSWSLNSNGAGSVQVTVRDTAGNSGPALTINTTLPPAIPLPVTPNLPAAATATPFAAVPGADDQQGPDRPDATAPLVLPLTSVGGDIAASWPGAAPKPMLDILPAAITLPPVPGFDPGRPVARLTDVQGSTGVTFQIATVPELPGGEVLIAYQPIPDISSASGQRISVQVSSDAFAHSSKNASVELSAQSADGTPLPGWIKFDGRTGRFEGTPPPAFEGTLSFKVTARDSQGHLATQVFKIVVSKDGQAGKRGEWHSEPAGRSSLGEQLRAARSAGAARLPVRST